jgi:hypothetical protein
MHKTGCTHIAKLLSQIFSGQQIGKHNTAPSELIATGSYFVSSIRNPWDWYLSLWTYGVQGKGRLWQDLTHSSERNGFLSESELTPWRGVYDDIENVESFRRWLKMIQNPDNSSLLGEDYSRTIAPYFCGLMTYRHLYLCCQNTKNLLIPSNIYDFNALQQFYNENYYINFIVHQERLNDELQAAIENIRPLTPSEKSLIHYAKKTNTSRREYSLAEYYDDETCNLVANRERIIVEKFGYMPPL